MKSQKLQSIVKVLFFVTIFLSLFCFFTVVHPLYIYDMDDWTYVIQTRKAIPLWKSWNPTRVFPETLMPLTAEIGIRLFMPFNGDYILSMGIAFAIVLSACYSIYFLLFYKLARRMFDISVGYGTVLTGTILLMHFLPFMKNMTGNGYMFAAPSVVCVFYYTIPALFNAMLVMAFSHDDSFMEREMGELLRRPKSTDGIWLLLIYLAINSNMFQSILLMSYICGTLLMDFIEELICERKQTRLLIIQYCKKRMVKLSVIVIWLLSLLMEANGGRATSMGTSESFGGALVACMEAFFKTIFGLNHFFTGMVAIVIVAAFIILIKRWKNRGELETKYVGLMIRYIVGMVITIICLIMLCAKVGLGYFTRNDVFSGILFYALLITWISMVYIVRRLSVSSVFIPIGVYVLLFATVINVRSYREFNVSGYDARIVKDISDDIVAQVVAANEKGCNAVEVQVPVYNLEGNWPIPILSGERISRTLRAHGIIGRQMEITVIPTNEMNEKYHLE